MLPGFYGGKYCMLTICLPLLGLRHDGDTAAEVRPRRRLVWVHDAATAGSCSWTTISHPRKLLHLYGRTIVYLPAAE